MVGASRPRRAAGRDAGAGLLLGEVAFVQHRQEGFLAADRGDLGCRGPIRLSDSSGDLTSKRYMSWSARPSPRTVTVPNSGSSISAFLHLGDDGRAVLGAAQCLDRSEIGHRAGIDAGLHHRRLRRARP